MNFRIVADVLPAVILLPLGMTGGAALARWFDERFDVQNDGYLQLVSLGLVFVGCGIAVGVYLVWLSAIKRLTGTAASGTTEADYDDNASK